MDKDLANCITSTNLNKFEYRSFVDKMAMIQTSKYGGGCDNPTCGDPNCPGPNCPRMTINLA